jgi:hypothetical protein
VVPVPLPAHVQFQGPLPETLEAVPVVQRLEDGALETVVPFAVPHVPFTFVPVTVTVADAVTVEAPLRQVTV